MIVGEYTLATALERQRQVYIDLTGGGCGYSDRRAVMFVTCPESLRRNIKRSTNIGHVRNMWRMRRWSVGERQLGMFVTYGDPGWARA